ncbi:MAG: ABC transporter ATP-binding protein/permease [Oscillospiraceae bacterium]|nr:ABC transporter ATP-binding protein/permease [Oscillospiraceae bacterium]
MNTLKILGRQVKEYKRDSILCPVFTALEVLMEVLIPFVTAAIIDSGIQGGDMRKVLLYGALMLVMAFLSLFFGMRAGTYGASASSGFACNLRDAMYENIQTFSFSDIDKYSTAGLVTRMTTDVTNVQNAYQMLIRMVVRAPLMLICSMVMCFVISPRLSAVFLVALIFLGIVLFSIALKSMPMFRRVFDKYDDLNASVQENVSGIRVVKAYVREDYEDKKFSKASENLCRMFVKAESILAFNNPVMMLTIYGCIIALSWFGARFIVAGSMTTGNVTSLFSYVMGMMMSLMMLSMVFVMVSMSAASGRRIAQVLNEKADLTNPAEPVTEVPTGEIDFDHVCFAYKKGSGEDVLHDIDLHIKAGETIGIIGGTGSGKSSLVSLISRLYDVTDGAVRVGGRDVREYDLETLRNQVAVVLQKNVLFSGTILDNLRWGKEDATLEECQEACQQACADEFIQRMPDKYDTWIEQGGTNVSGGQRQRLCIARALAVEPDILLLDESTSALDPISTSQIEDLIGDLKQQYTVIMVTHNMQQAVRISDWTAFFLLGELIEYGDTEQIFTMPKHKRTEEYISGRFG